MPTGREVVGGGWKRGRGGEMRVVYGVLEKGYSYLGL